MTGKTDKKMGNISDFLKEGDKKYNKELRERAKPKESLIIAEPFTVESIKYISNQKSITPSSEIVMGSNSPNYSAGISLRAIIKVDSEHDQTLPVKTLYFNGYLNLEKGDSIVAYLLKYNVEQEKGSSEFPVGGAEGNKTHYVDRDLKAEETVQRIEKLDKNDLKIVLAEYISE